jgi:hypothetical protein
VEARAAADFGLPRCFTFTPFLADFAASKCAGAVCIRAGCADWGLASDEAEAALRLMRYWILSTHKVLFQFCMVRERDINSLHIYKPSWFIHEFVLKNYDKSFIGKWKTFQGQINWVLVVVREGFFGIFLVSVGKFARFQ